MSFYKFISKDSDSKTGETVLCVVYQIAKMTVYRMGYGIVPADATTKKYNSK